MDYLDRLDDINEYNEHEKQLEEMYKMNEKEEEEIVQGMYLENELKRTQELFDKIEEKIKEINEILKGVKQC